MHFVQAHVEPCTQFYNSLCYWDASCAGSYAVHVRQENALAEGVTVGPGKPIAIAGSPFYVDVKSAKLDPYCTRADGKGVTRTEAALTAQFTVYGRDRFNNPCPGHELQVLIEPNNRIPVDLKILDVGSGEYKVTYTAPHSSGLFKISVALDGGKHIFNSPFVTLISPGEAYPPNWWNFSKVSLLRFHADKCPYISDVGAPRQQRVGRHIWAPQNPGRRGLYWVSGLHRPLWGKGRAPDPCPRQSEGMCLSEDSEFTI